MHLKSPMILLEAVFLSLRLLAIVHALSVSICHMQILIFSNAGILDGVPGENIGKDSKGLRTRLDNLKYANFQES